jgi:hypothetical protein
MDLWVTSGMHRSRALFEDIVRTHATPGPLMSASRKDGAGKGEGDVG